MLRRLSSPRVITWGCCLLSLALLSPSLGTGLVADDLLQQLLLQQDPGIRGLTYRPFDLFRFVDGGADACRSLIDEGVFPWWADPQAVLAFFRPLASLTHYLDYQLWPHAPALMHAHSLVWFGLLVALVAGVYRRFGTSPLGFGLPLFMFSVDDAHAAAVGWIANRNAIVAVCLALPALSWHDRLRREGFRHGLWLGPLALGAGLAAGETALTVCAYLLAYAIFLDPGSWGERARSLVPFAAVVLVWKLVTASLGYGSFGSGVYIDPIRTPVDFALAAATRLPVLALGLWALPFADLWEIYPLVAPGLRLAVILAACTLGCVLGFGARSLWRGNPTFRFWSVGAVLALVPVCATFPHDRLLLGASIGAMPVIGELLGLAYRQRRYLLPFLAMCGLGAIHLVFAPIALPFRAAHVGDFNRLLRAADPSRAAAIAGKTLILLNPPLDPFAAYLPIYWEAAGQSRPEHMLWLATGVSDLAITTLTDRQIAVRPSAGFLSSSSQWMLRHPGSGPRLAERIQVDAASVDVTELTSDGRPQQIVVSFPGPLDDPRKVWLKWQDGGYAPFSLPAVGSTTLLPAVAFRDLLFGGE